MLFLLTTCNQLVNESYGTRRKKSINGVDLFYSLLKSRSTHLKSEKFPSKNSLKKADLLVFFEKSPGGKSLQVLEAMWQGIEPQKKKRAKSKNADGQSKKSSKKISSGKVNTDYLAYSSRRRVILYLARETDASINFWSRLVRLMKDHPEAKKRSEAALKKKMRSVRFMPILWRTPFTKRTALHKKKRYESITYAISEFSGISRFPIKSMAEKRVSGNFSPLQHYRVLMTVDGQYHVLRLFKTKHADIIQLYNSEYLLNYPMALPDRSRFAKALIDFAINRARLSNPNHPKQIETRFIVNALLPEEIAAKSEQFLRAFRVYPINIILLHFIVLLAFYLWSKWPHEKTPLRPVQDGKREFMEHIKALGEKLEHSKNSAHVLRSIQTPIEARLEETKKKAGSE